MKRKPAEGEGVKPAEAPAAGALETPVAAAGEQPGETAPFECLSCPKTFRIKSNRDEHAKTCVRIEQPTYDQSVTAPVVL